MSSFGLGLITNKKHWKGVWINHRSPMPQNIVLKKTIKNCGQMRWTDVISRVVITEIRGDEVGIEIWCDNLIDLIRGKYRHNVIFLWVKYDLTWSCDGDMGRGEKMLRYYEKRNKNS